MSAGDDRDVSMLAALAANPPARLALRLVARHTHDHDTAEQVATLVDECVDAADRWGVQVAERRLLADADPTLAARRHLALVTAAMVVRQPLGERLHPPAGELQLRRLTRLEAGALRCVAVHAEAASIPVGLAEAGVTFTQQAALDTGSFLTAADDRIDVAVPAGERGTVARTVTMPAWATRPTAARLADPSIVETGPCYAGQSTVAGVRSKAVAARLDRVLAKVGLDVTAGSVRFTAGLDALDRGGPVAAARALGTRSIPATLRYLAQ